MPPDIKVLEAAGAIGDGRITLKRMNRRITAVVRSSMGDRSYNVVVVTPQDSFNQVFYVYSNDNGTRFRGYIGYPIIAVLMLAGLLPRNPKLEEGLKGIRWKELNERYKKYNITKQYVLKAASRVLPEHEVTEYVRTVLDSLKRMAIYYDPRLAKAG